MTNANATTNTVPLSSKSKVWTNCKEAVESGLYIGIAVGTATAVITGVTLLVGMAFGKSDKS